MAAVSGLIQPVASSWRSYLVPWAMLVASVVLVGWLDFRPAPSQPVLAIFPPGEAQSYPFLAAVAAGGRVIGFGALSNSVVTQSNDPGFFARLHAAGAMILVDATGRAGCGSDPKRPK